MGSKNTNGLKLNVIVHPISRENTIHIGDNGTIKIRVTSPEESNKANSAAIELLSETIGIPKTDIQILRGRTQKQKLFTFYSVDHKTFIGRLKLQKSH